LGNSTTILKHDDKIVSNQEQGCSIFNDFFVNVARDIGCDVDDPRSTHPSIAAIQLNSKNVHGFEFTKVSDETLLNTITKINSKKATGIDNIPGKLVNCA
jgi:hypothetical protein